jgi:FdrA protein
MISKNIILKNRYYDSVVLMNAAGKIREIPFVKEASLMMGTDANKELLKATQLLTEEGITAGAGDLILSLKLEDGINIKEYSDKAVQLMEEVLAPKVSAGDDEYNPKTLKGAQSLLPGINLAVVSIPGEHVEYTADELLDRGIHIMLFSDNVPLETEVSLKKKGEKLGLLVMGPDCGTVLIGGKALGFANKVRQGNIGIVAAAGTGIQEVSTLLHKMGGGVSHAIGTGGRDLSKDVGGITMKMGIRTLLNDPETEVLVLVSKPPHPDVEQEIYRMLEGIEKPVVINFLGSTETGLKQKNVRFAKTLEEAALEAMRLSGAEPGLIEPDVSLAAFDNKLHRLAGAQKYLRGLYSGGTLANETRLILEWEGLFIRSNLHKDPEHRLKNPFVSEENTIVDMGDDVFTKGAPHPMIDSTRRIARIIDEARDPETAVILLDLVLGYGAHPDPAPEIAETIIKAREIAEADGRYLIFAASVCGVPGDPQNSDRQVKIMEDAGVLVFPSNASATRFAAGIMKKLSAGVF